MPSAKSEKTGISAIIEKFIPVLLVVTIVLAFVVGVLWEKVNKLEKGNVSGTTTATTETQEAAPAKISLDQIKALWNKDVIKFGDVSKKVLFVEVGDPSCPYCHVAAGKNPELNKQIGGNFILVKDGGTYISPVVEMKKLVDAGRASFVYIYTPGHGNGEMAMKALYCANEKGKFWEAHDLLMTSAGYDLQNTTVKNDKTQSGKIADFIKSAVDPVFIKGCLDSGKYDSRLTEDTNLARSLGVRGTPGFFVNDTNFAGAYSYKDIQPTVDAALK